MKTITISDETWRGLQERAVPLRSHDPDRLDTPGKVIAALLDSPTFTPDEIRGIAAAVKVAYDDPESTPPEYAEIGAKLWDRFRGDLAR